MAAGAPGELDGQGLVARGARRSTSREGAACDARDQRGRGARAAGGTHNQDGRPGGAPAADGRRHALALLSGEPRPSRATSSPTGSVSTVPYAGLPCWSFSSASSAAQVIWQGCWLWGTRCGTDHGSPQRRCSWRRSRGGRCCRGSASRRHLPATSCGCSSDHLQHHPLSRSSWTSHATMYSVPTVMHTVCRGQPAAVAHPCV